MTNDIRFSFDAKKMQELLKLNPAYITVSSKLSKVFIRNNAPGVGDEQAAAVDKESEGGGKEMIVITVTAEAHSQDGQLLAGSIEGCPCPPCVGPPPSIEKEQ